MNLIRDLPMVSPSSPSKSAPHSPNNRGGRRRLRPTVSLISDDPALDEEATEEFRLKMNELVCGQGSHQDGCNHCDDYNNKPKKPTFINVWRCPETGQDIWEHELNRAKRRELKELRLCPKVIRYSIKASHLYGRFQPTQGHFCCRACGVALFSARSKMILSAAPPSSSHRPNFERAVEHCIRVVPGTKKVYQQQQQQKQQQQKHPTSLHWQFDTQCAQCQAPLGRVSLDRTPHNKQYQQPYSPERHIVHGLSLTYRSANLPPSVREVSSVLFMPSAARTVRTVSAPTPPPLTPSSYTTTTTTTRGYHNKEQGGGGGARTPRAIQKALLRRKSTY